MAPRPKVYRTPAVQDADEVVPVGIGIQELAQVFPDAVPEGIFSQQAGEHPHHDGSLVIDDVSVDESGTGQVRQIPPDGVGSGGPVFGIGGDVEVPEIPQGDVHIREHRRADPGAEIIGEDLLRPDVVEPAHGHGVPEPEVGGLMGDEFRPRELFRRGRRGVQEHPLVIEQDGAGVLHAAELEAGNDHEVILVEGTGDTGIVFQPVQGLENQREDVVHLGRFRRIRLPVIDAQGFAGTDAGLFFPQAGRKGEEIGTQRPGFPESHPFPSLDGLRGRFGPVGDGFPPGWKFQRQGKPPLEVRLVETRERGPRPVRHEERVQILFIAVE